jgi:hypothetical protein
VKDLSAPGDRSEQVKGGIPEAINTRQESTHVTEQHKLHRWRPLLKGAARAQALAVVDEISAELRQCGARGTDPSLAGGIAGLAVFYSYLAESRRERGDEKIALRLLDQASEAVAATRMSPDLFGGFTGIAWAMAHLERRLQEIDSVEAIDEALQRHLGQAPWRREYDVVSGLVGFAVYALERFPRKSAIACLELIVEHLASIAQRSAAGVTWFTPPELLPPHQLEQCPNGHYNLGLAHGVPGVIALLAPVCAISDNRLRSLRKKARPLLDRAVAWLLAQQPPNREANFPPYVGRGVLPRRGRVAWCYGDLGIAVALLLAARSVRNRVWERAALEIARRAASRRTDEAGIVDCGLCHGAAGVGHLFNRLFQATGEESFADAACFWFERVLEMREPGRGVRGFFAVRIDPKTGSRRAVAEVGMLEGAAGVGLALLAASTSIEPQWDRLLLVSIPPRPSMAGQRKNGRNNHGEVEKEKASDEWAQREYAAA